MQRFRPPWFICLTFLALLAAGCQRESTALTATPDSPPDSYLPQIAPVGATLFDGLGASAGVYVFRNPVVFYKIAILKKAILKTLSYIKWALFSTK